MRKVARFFLRRYCCVFWAAVVVSISTGILGYLLITADAKRLRGEEELLAPTSVYDWYVNSTASWENDMVESAERQIDAGFTNATERSVPAPASSTSITIAYFWRDSSMAAEIWTPAALQQMCEVERVITALPGYQDVCLAQGNDCAPQSRSVVSLFYGGGPNGTTHSCPLLHGPTVASRAATLYAAGQSADVDVATAAGFLLGYDSYAFTPPRTSSTRSVITFAVPLAGYASARDREDEQVAAIQRFVLEAETALLDHFGMGGGLFASPYRQPAHTPLLDVRWLAYEMVDQEFVRMSTSDFTAVLFSILFVCGYIGLHNRSFTIGCFGILLILFSFPLSMFFFAVARVAWFSSIHILVLFLVLGVGADDIFVFMDAWRHGAGMPLEDRLVYTYSHTAKAVFSTSFTTALAFFTTAVSPIMPIASFGVFAGFAILMNYLLMLTFWPAAVLIHEIHLGGAKCVGCCCPCVPACAVERGDMEAMASPAGTSQPRSTGDGTGDGDAGRIYTMDSDAVVPGMPPGKAEQKTEHAGLQFGCIEKFFANWFAPLITWSVDKRGWVKPVSLFLVVAMTTTGVLLSGEALKMQPPTQEEQWFPVDHMHEGLVTKMQQTFLVSATDDYLKGSLYLGLVGLVRTSKFNRWAPTFHRGDVVFDDALDLSDGAAQTALFRLCADLRKAPCNEAGCTRPPMSLVVPTTVKCFIEAFNASVAGHLPTGAAFDAQLMSWLQTAAGEPYQDQVGLVSGRVRFVNIPFELTMLQDQPGPIVTPIYDRLREVCQAHAASAPASLRSCLAHGGNEFVWVATEAKLVDGVKLGFAICFPVAFLVLLSATGSVRVAMLAIIAIAFVVGSLLGTVKSAFGWSLGTAECISATIVLGLSVDYTIHFGHIIAQSSQSTRGGKVADAATLMGVTVVAGTVTTLGSSLFMFMCQLTFFTKMATLIAGTITWSVLYALLFFIPICALIGPEGKVHSLRERAVAVRAWLRASRGARQADTPARQVPRASEPPA